MRQRVSKDAAEFIFSAGHGSTFKSALFLQKDSHGKINFPFASDYLLQTASGLETQECAHV